MKYKIIPTLIAKNQKDLDSLLTKYNKHFNYFQVDVMYGKFVKSKSNWFNFKLDKKNKYEAHLMVDNPEKWIKKHYKQFVVLIANFERIKNPLSLIKFVKSKRKKIGFALNPETSVTEVKPYLKYLDRVLILAVHPGMYGAHFLPRNLEKIKMLRDIYKKDIEIDGHEDPKHIRLCKKAGANLFAVGSYLKNSTNLEQDIKKLNDIIKFTK